MTAWSRTKAISTQSSQALTTYVSARRFTVWERLWEACNMSCAFLSVLGTFCVGLFAVSLWNVKHKWML